LDELDQLIMAKQADILYKLFEITALPRSSLVFIGAWVFRRRPLQRCVLTWRGGVQGWPTHFG
jgi:hypothetical protein